MELVIARNPDPDSRLGYLLRVPLGDGLLFRTSGTWPRTTALYCYPVPLDEWPADPDLVERVRLRSCVRRGAAIELVLDRARESRSQLVYTKARGRDAVFWQSARTRKKARPNVRTPTARASGVTELEVVVDSHEQYPYRFARHPARVVRRALPCGDYGVVTDGTLVAAVERKSLADLVSTLTGGKLGYAMAELATLPRAALVVEERYSQVFKLERVRPATVADGVAEVQVRWPTVPLVFCDTRRLAEEWTYRYLAAAQVWASAEPAAVARIGALDESGPGGRSGASSSGGVVGPDVPEPTTAEVRAWAREEGLGVSDRGRLPPQIWEAWRAASQS